jgi:hypothetical protein
MMLSQSHEGTKKDGNPYKALTTESTENTEETMNLLRVGFGYVGFLLLFSVPSVSWFIAVKFFIAPCPTLVFEGLNRALTLLHTG